MTDPQPPDNRVDHNQQDGENNVQQNIGQVSRSTIKGRETNLHLSGIPVLIVALALVILVGFIVLVMRPDKPEEIEPTLVSEATRVPPGAQAESYLFYVDVSANMNKVIGGKQAYEWAQDVIAGIWNGIRIDPDQTRSALLKVGGGMSSACNQIEQVDFGLGSSLPVSDYLSPLNRTQPGGDSAYAEGFVNAMDYFQAPDASQSERKYLIALMGDYRGTPGCERQDRLDLPGLLERYSDNWIEVELCAFSFLSDDTQFAVWLRDQIQDYTVDCVLNIRNEADVQAASSRTVNIINNNRVQFEHTATPAPSTVTPTLTPSPRPSDTPTVTTTPPTATSTITPRPTNTPTPTLTVTAGPTTTPVVCPGALPPRLSPGQTGRVVPGPDNNVRTNPSISESRVTRLSAESIFTVLDGPVCADGYAWYQIRTEDGSVEGWTVEGDSEAYWLEPVEANSVTIYRQEDALTLYLSVSTTVDFSGLSVGTDQMELSVADDFPLLSELPLDSNDELCLIYKRDGTNPVRPLSCGSNTLEFELHPADIFWFNSDTRQQVDLVIRYEGQVFICSADPDVCVVSLRGNTDGSDRSF